jgi:hypothetical protein
MGSGGSCYVAIKALNNATFRNWDGGIIEIGTDDRYCFFDETATKMALWSWYDLEAAREGWLLLKRRAVADSVTVENYNVHSGQLGEWIEVPPSSTWLLGNVDVSYSLAGRLRAFAYKPAKLFVEFELESGDRVSYWAVLPIIQAGVLLNRFVADTGSARLFFRGRVNRLPKITRFRLFSDQSWAFGKDFSIRFSKVLGGQEKASMD